jgi:diguanylate cyclase (GGDEF)-like protein/PAS domain S-box-containing protein
VENTDPSSWSPRRRLAVGASVLATVVYLAAISARPGGAQRWTAFDDIGQAITPAIAAAACWWTARRSSGREKRAWALIGAGAASWGVGQVIWTIDEVGLGHQPVSPSPCDVGFLLAPLLVIAGLLLFVDTPAGSWSWVRGAFEGLLIAGGLLVAVWTIMLAPVAGASHDPLIEQVVALAYPVLDAMGISALLFMATRRRTHEFGRLSVLAAGIALLAVSDSAFWYLTTVHNFDDVNPTDAGWFAGWLLVAFGAMAVRRGSRPTIDADEADGPVFHHRRLVLAVPELVALAGLAAAAADRLIAGRGSFERSVAWMVLGVAGLALAHGVSVVVENHALTANLEHRVAQRTEMLAGRERHFAALVEHSSDIVAVISADLVITSISSGVREVYGWVADTIVDHRLEDFGDRFRPMIEAVLSSAATPGLVHRFSWDLFDTSGRQRFAESQITNLVADADICGYVVNTRDVTDQTLLERELRHQAFHDHLSGLPNRALFHDRAEHALARARRTGAEVAVLMIDLDGFKDVNDSLGHLAGDALLCRVAEQLVVVARPGDTVARLGGDEFVVLMEDLTSPDAAVGAAERIRAALRDAAMVADADITLTASTGVSIGEGSTSSVSDLLRDADIAMYVAKDDGKDAVRLFEPWMRDKARARFQVQSEFAGALDRREFTLYYQPTYELRTGRLEGFEALMRWNHPTLGVIPPDQFIPIAEDTGFIVPLGRWALYEATRQLAQWSRALGDGRALTIAINVSARQIRDPRLTEDVRDAIAAAGIAPERVVLEVTETMLVHDPAEVADVLHALKALGVRISIDDFGTGYSSLSYLQNLPIDILKVDKAFVATVDENNTETHKLVLAILNMARSLGLRTVAEGVEEPGQAAFLATSGCDIGQGFLWARPLTTDDAWQLLNTPHPANDQTTLTTTIPG